MGQVLIRNIDDSVIASLKTRAKLRGESLETFLREQLTSLAPLSGEERLRLLQSYRDTFGELSVSTPPEDVVRQERDRL